MSKFWKTLTKIQKAIDLTPYLLSFALRMQSTGVNLLLFVFFLLIGFFGLFVPIIQGWLTIGLAFTFLGIKPLNLFIKRNKKGIQNVGTVLFTLTLLLFLGSFVTWILGITDDSPGKNILDVVQYGREDIEEARDSTISIIGLEPEDLESLSFVDYRNTAG